MGARVQPSYIWIVFLAVAWPIAALGITILYSGHLPKGGYELMAEALGFLRVGIYSGLALIVLMRKAATQRASTYVITGYMLMVPLAYLLGVVGPLTLRILGELPQALDKLVLTPLAIGFWGSLPLIGGAAVGLWIGNA